MLEISSSRPALHSAPHSTTTSSITTTTTTSITTVSEPLHHHHLHHTHHLTSSNNTNLPVVLRPTKVAHKIHQHYSAPRDTVVQLDKTPGAPIPAQGGSLQEITRKRARDGQPIVRVTTSTDEKPMKLHAAGLLKGQSKLSFGSNGVLGINGFNPPSASPPTVIEVPRTSRQEVDAVAGAEKISPEEKDADQSKKKGEEKRSLRSKAGGSRLKSALTHYFTNYDDIIAGIPQSPEYVGVDEPISITDTPLPPSNSPPAKINVASLPLHTKTNTHTPTFSSIDLFELVPASLTITTPTIDPLDESIYLAIHKRAERREKQLRNIEKEHAQHEKGQLETLLEALQGPDWLKTMGITGVTDGARKDFEPKRDYFIKEVRALLRKFKVWKEAEKRLLQGKAAREGEDDGEDGAEEDDEMDDAVSTDINSSDADAWAARQLRLEAKTAAKSTKSRPKPKAQLPPKPPEPPKPFTSFFAKPHLRTAALSKHRSGRRTVLAFGHAVPELQYDVDFELGEDLLTEEVLRAQARKRRRMNRDKNDENEKPVPSQE